MPPSSSSAATAISTDPCKRSAISTDSCSNSKELADRSSSSPSPPSSLPTAAAAAGVDLPLPKQDLQSRRAKLVAMLEEVDRRYKLYFGQIEAVMEAFESAAGIGAAKTYATLALQTISKHFRGLRDAIGAQIEATSRALSHGHGQGSSPAMEPAAGKHLLPPPASRAQAGMMMMMVMGQDQAPPPPPPPPAWRPQRGLPEHSVSVLRAWLFDHFLHP
jgi:hypothetical protein